MKSKQTDFFKLVTTDGQVHQSVVGLQTTVFSKRLSFMLVRIWAMTVVPQQRCWQSDINSQKYLVRL